MCSASSMVAAVVPFHIVSSKELIKAAFEKNPSIPVRGAAKVNGSKSLLALFDYCLGYKLF